MYFLSGESEGDWSIVLFVQAFCFSPCNFSAPFSFHSWSPFLLNNIPRIVIGRNYCSWFRIRSIRNESYCKCLCSLCWLVHYRNLKLSDAQWRGVGKSPEKEVSWWLMVVGWQWERERGRTQSRRMSACSAHITHCRYSHNRQHHNNIHNTGPGEQWEAGVTVIHP